MEKGKKQTRESKYQGLVDRALKHPKLDKNLLGKPEFHNFRESLIEGAQEIATRVYNTEDSRGIENDVQDLATLRYAYIMSRPAHKLGLDKLFGEVRSLISDRLDYLRVKEMREQVRESVRRRQ